MEESTCPATPPSLGNSPKSRWDDTPEKKDREKSSSPVGSRPSSPENCAICLGALTNKSFTNSCLHTFCFVCLLEWSKVKAECPLCKVAFNSIIHNVRSEEDYDQYHVKQRTENPYESARTFRYRTTLTTYGEFSNWMSRQTGGAFLPIPQQRLASGVPDAIPSRFISHYRPYRSSATSEFRRSIYQDDLWARLQPDVTGRYRECSPEFYRQNPAAMHRLIPFLNRELNVVLENGSRCAYILHRILEHLTRYSITSPEFRSRISNFIGSQNAAHFCHELQAYASSPFDMVGYDRSVEYVANNNNANASEQVIHSISSESDSTNSDSDHDSDIQVLNTEPAVPSRVLEHRDLVGHVEPASSYRMSIASTSTSSVASSAPPPSPQPGPSGISGGYISPDQDKHRAAALVSISSSSSESENEDVQIVGYVKPRHERTPEIITLSSPEHRSQTANATPLEIMDASNSVADDSDLVCINLGSCASTSMRWEDSNFESQSSDDVEYKPEVKYTPYRNSSSRLQKKNNQSHVRKLKGSKISLDYSDASDSSSSCPSSSRSVSSSSSDSNWSSPGRKDSQRRNKKKNVPPRSSSSKHKSTSFPSSNESSSEALPSTSRGRSRKSTSFPSSNESSSEALPSTSRGRSRKRGEKTSHFSHSKKPSKGSKTRNSSKSTKSSKSKRVHHRSESGSDSDGSRYSRSKTRFKHSNVARYNHTRNGSSSGGRKERSHGSYSPSCNLKETSLVSTDSTLSPKLCSIVMTKTTTGAGEESWSVDRAHHKRQSSSHQSRLQSFVLPPSSASSQNNQDYRESARHHSTASSSSSKCRQPQDDSSSNSRSKRKKKDARDERSKKKKKKRKRSKSKDSPSPHRDQKRKRSVPLCSKDSDS